MSNIDEHECQLPSESPPLLTLTDSNNNDHGEHRSKANGKDLLFTSITVALLPVELIARQFASPSYSRSLSLFLAAETLLPNDNHNNSEQPSAIIILPARASPSTMDIIPRENEDAAAAAGKQQQQTPSPLPAEPIASSTNPTSIISPSHLSSSSSISSTVILRDHAETIRTRRQCHSSISLLQHQQRHEQSLSTAFEEPFNDYKQAILARKVELNSNMTQAKVSACTMTGRSLNNLDECASSSSSSSSSEDKGVQTILDEPAAMNACIKRAISSTSLSSSSAASIPIDTHEKKSLLPTTSPDEPVTAAANDHSPVQHATEPQYKWPHLHERLLGEHTCVYWVNYLGKSETTLAKVQQTHRISSLDTCWREMRLDEGFSSGIFRSRRIADKYFDCAREYDRLPSEDTLTLLVPHETRSLWSDSIISPPPLRCHSHGAALRIHYSTRHSCHR